MTDFTSIIALYQAATEPKILFSWEDQPWFDCIISGGTFELVFDTFSVCSGSAGEYGTVTFNSKNGSNLHIGGVVKARVFDSVFCLDTYQRSIFFRIITSK